MKAPSFYINVSQTIFALLAVGLVGSYIFKKDFREDVNAVFANMMMR